MTKRFLFLIEDVIERASRLNEAERQKVIEKVSPNTKQTDIDTLEVEKPESTENIKVEKPEDIKTEEVKHKKVLVRDKPKSICTVQNRR